MTDANASPLRGDSLGQTTDAFRAEIDAIRKREYSRVGDSDLRRMQRIEAFSFVCEFAGRLLLHFSVGPWIWLAGTLALWLRKQLQVELGHTVLHGCFDKIDTTGRYHSARFRWDAPIEESSWRRGHNVDHHGHTNIVGLDPDIRFGKVRLTAALPYQRDYRFGLLNDLLIWPWFFLSITLYYTGLSDLYIRRDDFQYIRKKDWATIKRCHALALRKVAPYTLYNFVLFPALAGTGFWKVLLGNIVAEVLRDVIMAAAIHCGHVGVEGYPPGTRTSSRGRWYELQVRASHNFQTSHLTSVLIGGLNFQIEHHLFPKLPPNRLREIAPEVRKVCASHGVPYATGPWARVLWQAMRHIVELSRPPRAEPLASQRSIR